MSFAPFKTDERLSNFDFTNDILMYVLAYWVLNYFADAWLKLIDSYYSIGIVSCQYVF